MKMTREQAKEYVLANAEQHLIKANKTGYICPICNNGTGKNGTGITKKPNTNSYKCFSCDFYGDIFDIVGAEYGITDNKEKFAKTYDIFNIEVENDNAGTYNKPNVKQELQQPQEEQTDYTNFFLQAQKNIEKTSYLTDRGISLEVQKKYGIGYMENWKVSEKAYPSNRVIIPTSKYSYLARDTEINNDYSKIKIGKVHLFNAGALRQDKPLFIVEGEIDALSIIECGYNALALGSTANKNKLIELLKQLETAPELILSLDNDNAGISNSNELEIALNSLNLVHTAFNISGVYKDPNEHLKRDKNAFKSVLQQAINSIGQSQQEDKENYINQASNKQAIQDFLQTIKNSTNNKATSTGFNNLDEILDGGLYAGLYVIGAISSLGKTTFTLQIADQIAEQGKDVLIFSLEMARNELIAKSISRFSFIGSSAYAKTTRGILTGSRYTNYSDEETSVINNAISRYNAFSDKVYIYEGVGDISVLNVRTALEKHIKLTGRTPIIFIDYLQILAPYNDRANDKQNTDKAVLELKRISRDFGTSVFVISSFNRENYQAPVSLTSFKESGAIEYSSDILIGLQYRGMEYQEGEKDNDRQKRIRELTKDMQARAKNGQPQEIEVKILKNRNGSKGNISFNFNPQYNIFLEDKQQEQQTRRTIR